MVRWITLVAGTWLIAACSGTPDDPSAAASPAISDSAGIRIVENPAPTAERPWSVSAEPSLRIGGGSVSGEGVDLYEVRGAIRLPGDTFAVANGGTSEILFFGPSGDLLEAVGGQGEGPGEFGALGGLWRLPPDSLLAWDRGNRRLTVYGPDRTRVRDAPIDAFRPVMIGPARDGLLVMFLPPLDPSPSGALGSVKRDEVLLVRYGTDGALLDSLGAFPGTEMMVYEWRFAEQTSRISSPLPFGLAPVAAGTTDGIYYGSGDLYEIRRYAGGDLGALIRRVERDRTLERSTIEAYEASRMEDAPDDPGGRAAWEAFFDDVPYPSEVPAYQHMQVDVEGHLWVQEYGRLDRNDVTWSVFDPGGVWVADVTLPKSELLDIGRDYVLALHRDDLDLESVGLHRLDR